MALTLETQNYVWQKVKNSTESLAIRPGINDALRALKAHIQAKFGNINLQFVPISDLGADAIIADVACKVFAVVLKKGATATGAFFKGADSATSAGTTASDVVQELNESGHQVLIEHINGWAQGSGFTVGSDTTADGSTASTSGDGPNGFAIIGAA